MYSVMAGLAPAIHVLGAQAKQVVGTQAKQDVDARHEAGRDRAKYPTDDMVAS